MNTTNRSQWTTTITNKKKAEVAPLMKAAWWKKKKSLGINRKTWDFNHHWSFCWRERKHLCGRMRRQHPSSNDSMKPAQMVCLVFSCLKVWVVLLRVACAYLHLPHWIHWRISAASLFSPNVHITVVNRNIHEFTFCFSLFWGVGWGGVVTSLGLHCESANSQHSPALTL